MTTCQKWPQFTDPEGGRCTLEPIKESPSKNGTQ